jgi:succinate dehydrogenase / fumarate reductase iron-sulfur subunit
MRKFSDGDTIWIEPFRANPFPVVRDLMVDRSAFDRIIAAGGYVDVRTGSAVDANATLVPKADADTAFDAAACIGCGACVASCKNASAMLFVGAKVSHLGHLPQGASNGLRRFWQLHQSIRVRGRLPERDQRRAHCPTQSRLRRGRCS